MYRNQCREDDCTYLSEDLYRLHFCPWCGSPEMDHVAINPDTTAEHERLFHTTPDKETTNG
jgi:hypothetical protein